MLKNIRNFSKTIFAKVLLIIIIIPFVFWGMGGVFNSGNSNNIVKINNNNISTQDFIDFLNSSNLDQEQIKANINNNVIEELLSEQISREILKLQVNDLNIILSEEALAERIRKNKNFHGENKKFSRTKYEKFLLSQNLTATEFEKRLKLTEQRKNLFSYVSGGIKSPSFLIKKTFEEQNSELEIDYIELKDKYAKKNSFTNKQIEEFIKKNKEKLKVEYIDFAYFKITPENLTGNSEYNKSFFEKIDEIENRLSNENFKLSELASELKIDLVSKKKFIQTSESNIVEKKIYQNRNNNEIQLVDENDYYLIYEIQKNEKILPDFTDVEFKNQIITFIHQESIFEFNKDLLKKIEEKKYTTQDFSILGGNGIKKIILKSQTDDTKFETNSVKILYSLPLDSFSLVADADQNIYLAKIKNITSGKMPNDVEKLKIVENQTNVKMRDNLYSSYDLLLSDKYEININQGALERVKNFFK